MNFNKMLYLAKWKGNVVIKEGGEKNMFNWNKRPSNFAGIKEVQFEIIWRDFTSCFLKQLPQIGLTWLTPLINHLVKLIPQQLN